MTTTDSRDIRIYCSIVSMYFWFILFGISNKATLPVTVALQVASVFQNVEIKKPKHFEVSTNSF